MAAERWVLCGRCGGEGAVFGKPSKRARHLYREALAAVAAVAESCSDVPPPRPPRQRLQCTQCAGVGLVPSEAAADSGATCCGGGCGRVVIVGGGIGGLAAAAALSARGIAVTVFEKDVHYAARRQGYGLTLQQGARAIEQLGLTLGHGIVSTAHFSLAPNGDLLGCYGKRVYGAAGLEDTVGGSAVNRGSTRAARQRHNVHVPRQLLRLELLNLLPKGTVQWGKALVGFEETSAGVTCTFADGSTEKCAVLVGADGIFSTVRRLKMPDTKLNFLGVVVILGFAVSNHPLVDHTIFQTLDGETRVYAMPFATDKCAAKMGLHTGADIAMWQLSFPVSSLEEARHVSRNPTVLKATALARCGDWHEPIPSLLQSTLEENVSGYPVYDRERPPDSVLRAGAACNSDSRVTILGDAAHPMSPFKGQGANQALLDGVLLAKHIYRTSLAHKTSCTKWGQLNAVPAALAAFEMEMQHRSETKVRQSRDAAKALHSAAALAATSCTRAAAAKGNTAANCVDAADMAWARSYVATALGKSDTLPP